MDSSSKRIWISSVVLSSALLFSSLSGNHAPGNATEPVIGSESIPLGNSSLFTAQSVRYDIVLAASKAAKDGVPAQPAALATLASVQEVTLAREGAKNVAQSTASVSAEKVTPPTERATKQVAVVPSTERSRGGSSKVDEIIRNAQSLIGIPYVFGGTTTKGFDCSGFTQYVYKGSGIELPRTSYTQYGSGAAVKKDQLQSGDLVFFSTYDQGASHVGIYIGGGSFIHAASAGIKITSLSDSYYSSRYIGARRVL